MSRRTVIIGLDGVVCAEGQPIYAVIDVINELAVNNQIVLITDRHQRDYETTVDWLEESGLIYDELHMRAEGDHRTTAAYKFDVLQQLKTKSHDVYLAIEEYESTVVMWRANGIHCLQTQAV